MTGAARTEVTDDLGVVARVGFVPAGDGVEVHVATPRLVLVPEEAAQVLATVERETAGAGRVVLVTMDAVLRESARAAGYAGGLREDLVRVDGSRGAVPDTVAGWLPDAQVVARPVSPPRRLTRLLATGLDRMTRIDARRHGFDASVTVPIGPGTLLEPVAATVDTLLELARRLGGARVRVPPITFSLNDGGIRGGSVAGGNAGAGIVLTPMYVDVDALVRIRRRRDAVARVTAVAGGRRSTRAAPDHAFAVEKTVVHEVGHSVDQAPGSGRLSDTVTARRTLGRAVGVDSVELALRSDWLDAPPEWRAARARIVADLSDYATTNCVELFAEAFVAWYLRDGTPIAAAMDEVLRTRYPDLP